MKKSAFFGLGVAVAATGVVATTVFACTAFVGTFTLNGATGSQVSTGNDTCTNWTMTSTCTFNMSQTLSGTEAATSHTTSGQFTIAWSIPAANGEAAALVGTYEVNFVGGDAYDNRGSWKLDCMHGSSGSGQVHLGNTTVAQDTVSPFNGKITGTTTWNVPSSQVANSTSPDQESAVCISDGSANFGNQAPIELT